MKTNEKNRTIHLQTIKTLFHLQMETGVDKRGYSQQRVIDFIKLLAISFPAPISELLKIRYQHMEDGRMVLIECNPGEYGKLITTLLLTKTHKDILQKWHYQDPTEYIFPYLLLTEEDNSLLDQVGLPGDANYYAVHTAIQAQKIKDFHKHMDAYLLQLSNQLQLNFTITLRLLYESLLEHTYCYIAEQNISVNNALPFNLENHFLK